MSRIETHVCHVVGGVVGCAHTGAECQDRGPVRDYCHRERQPPGPGIASSLMGPILTALGAPGSESGPLRAPSQAGVFPKGHVGCIRRGAFGNDGPLPAARANPSTRLTSGLIQVGARGFEGSTWAHVHPIQRSIIVIRQVCIRADFGTRPCPQIGTGRTPGKCIQRASLVPVFPSLPIFCVFCPSAIGASLATAGN